MNIEDYWKKMDYLKEQFVSEELAEVAFENGFDDPCFGYFDSDGLMVGGFVGNTTNMNSLWVKESINPKISAPLIQQLEQWFRTKHSLHISIQTIPNHVTPKSDICYQWSIHKDNRYSAEKSCNEDTLTYDEAIHEALYSAFEIIKE